MKNLVLIISLILSVLAVAIISYGKTTSNDSVNGGSTVTLNFLSECKQLREYELIPFAVLSKFINTRIELTDKNMVIIKTHYAETGCRRPVRVEVSTAVGVNSADGSMMTITHSQNSILAAWGFNHRTEGYTAISNRLKAEIQKVSLKAFEQINEISSMSELVTIPNGLFSSEIVPKTSTLVITPNTKILWMDGVLHYAVQSSK